MLVRFRDPGFPCGSVGKVSSFSVEDLGLIHGLGRSPGEGNPLHYSGLENSMHCIVQGMAKNPTLTERLSLSF